jgi:hypothetical protein
LTGTDAYGLVLVEKGMGRVLATPVHKMTRLS